MASRDPIRSLAGPAGTRVSRRGFIAGSASLGASGLWFGCGPTEENGVSGASTPVSPADGGPAMGAPSCVLRPRQTEGPYFIDEKLDRSDIRSDPVDGSVKPGVPLRLIFRALRADASCAPLAGAIIDLWQCDALGVYAGVADINAQFNTQGRKFLRGFQRTNAEGQSEFLTIYPGWYAGRAAHIHFKIRSDVRASFDYTSQIYFPESINDEVFKQPPYSSQSGRRSLNSQDGGFLSGGTELTPQITTEGAGYLATFDVGLRGV
jgi:protocatechuate 3,4-dioxygenase beta subunit